MRVTMWRTCDSRNVGSPSGGVQAAPKYRKLSCTCSVTTSVSAGTLVVRISEIGGRSCSRSRWNLGDSNCMRLATERYDANLLGQGQRASSSRRSCSCTRSPWPSGSSSSKKSSARAQASTLCSQARNSKVASGHLSPYASSASACNARFADGKCRAESAARRASQSVALATSSMEMPSELASSAASAVAAPTRPRRSAGFLEAKMLL
mmetsp:Transcript_6011/g.17436  ORF Transcript_6011/g.17436 Transcript_6011/m.17436 type:complete len:208 (-) Transcript_6011:909-1532(-)